MLGTDRGLTGYWEAAGSRTDKALPSGAHVPVQRDRQKAGKWV